jgi:short subunit dehydrogenase-like uncharacterized protein
MPVNPTLDQREANRYRAAVEVTAEDGTVVRSILDTVNGYTFTAIAAAEAALRVLKGEARPGFQTPAERYEGNGSKSGRRSVAGAPGPPSPPSAVTA